MRTLWIIKIITIPFYYFFHISHFGGSKDHQYRCRAYANAMERTQTKRNRNAYTLSRVDISIALKSKYWWWYYKYSVAFSPYAVHMPTCSNIIPIWNSRNTSKRSLMSSIIIIRCHLNYSVRMKNIVVSCGACELRTQRGGSILKFLFPFSRMVSIRLNLSVVVWSYRWVDVISMYTADANDAL